MFSSVVAAGKRTLSPGYQKEKVTVVGREVKCHLCGNIFMSDSNFCRKCGTRRPDITKKQRIGNTEVDDRLILVCSAVRDDDTPEAVKEISNDEKPGDIADSLAMLANGAKDSLGPKASERDEFQVETTKMIGKVLTDIKGRHERIIKELTAKWEAAKREVEKRTKERDSAKQRRDVAAEVVRKCEIELQKAVEKCMECKRILAERESELQVAIGDWEHEKRILEDWKQLLKDTYWRMKEGNVAPAEVEQLLNRLIPFLSTTWGKKYNMEECMLGALAPALREQNKSDRCDWCQEVFIWFEDEHNKKVEKPIAYMQKALRDQEARIAAAYKLVVTATAARDAAEVQRHQACDIEVPAAQKKLDQAMIALEKAEEDLRLAEDALREAERVRDEWRYKLDAAEAAYDRFLKGPWEAYEWLMKQEDGHYTDVTLKEIITYREYPEPIPPKVTSVDGGIDDGYSSVSHPCKEMLKNMSPSSLGPPSKRNHRQDATNTMIEKVLRRVLQKKEKDVVDAQAEVAKALAEEARCKKAMDDATISYEAAQKRYEEAQKRLADAQRRCAEATEAMHLAQIAVDQQQSVVDHLHQTLLAWEDAFKFHFVPLRDGPGVPQAHNHLNALKVLFDFWGEPYEFEECLLASFRSAATETPENRHSWCKKVFAEVERLWKAPVDKLKLELAAAQKKLAELQADLDKKKIIQDQVCNKEVPAAQAALDKAYDDMMKAKEVLDAAIAAWNKAKEWREVKDYELQLAKDALQRFKDGPWADFKWLCSHEKEKLH